uniref:4Fe-4S ferredoxin-type domain-containing protein n=1 Tax=Oryza nivara TaxID=4536 RepID=A0A0E0FQ66_ORYNI
MMRRPAPVLVLAILAVAASTAAAAAIEGEVKCGGCSPCGGADCPVLYPSPPPPALPPPPPYYYYSPPPPAYYPGSYCPPPPAAYVQFGGGAQSGRGPLYPQDPGFMPSSAPSSHGSRAVRLFTACAASASLWFLW